MLEDVFLLIKGFADVLLWQGHAYDPAGLLIDRGDCVGSPLQVGKVQLVTDKFGQDGIQSSGEKACCP